MSFDALSYAMGKAAGGGGGGSGIPLLTRAEWNALSTAQKQAYGLVAVQDANSGFDQGELYNGAAYVAPLYVYDHGTEGVAWSVSGGSKDADRITLTVGGGVGIIINYAITDESVDLTIYNHLTVTYIWNGTEYTKNFDITGYTETAYVSFRYYSDSSHNEGSIGISNTRESAGTLQLWTTTGATSSAALLALVLTS